MKLTRALTIATASLLSAGVQAQLLNNPAVLPDQGEWAYGLWLGTSTTDYELERSGETGDINRSSLAGSVEYGAHDKISVFGSAGYVFDAEDGNGHQFQLGAKGPLSFIHVDGMNFNWYSALSVIDDSLGEYEENNVRSVDNILSEWLLGGVAIKQINESLKLYGGVELVPFSLGEAVFKSINRQDDEYKTDFERDPKVGLRAGVMWNDIDFHVDLVHETSFLAGVRLPLGGYDYQLPQMPERAQQPSQTAPAPAAPAESAPREITFDPYANESSEKPTLGPRETLRLVQQKLNFRGYQAGPADGLMGKRTRAALIAFQKDRNLPQTGQADEATLNALGM